jgi:hypothetical protein
VLFRLVYLGVTNILGLLRVLPMSVRDTDAAILVLRHQIMLLERQLRGEKVRFTWARPYSNTSKAGKYPPRDRRAGRSVADADLAVVPAHLRRLRTGMRPTAARRPPPPPERAGAGSGRARTKTRQARSGRGTPGLGSAATRNRPDPAVGLSVHAADFRASQRLR